MQEAPAGKLPPVPVYRPLPGTESEVNDLEKRFRRTFPQAPPPLVLGEDQATKQAILAAAPAHRFLHLATHGFFAGESESSILLAEQRAALQRGDLRLLAGVAGRHPGLLSGLVFAGVNRSDRRPEETILTALEAAELELGQVELVVLSACNTGRGQVAGGEGVLGLQRAFQLAGARSVVASLWRVPDEETHQLMREFYRRVWSDKPVPRVEALRAGAALDAGELEAARRPGTSGTARTAATVRLGRLRPLGGLAVTDTTREFAGGDHNELVKVSMPIGGPVRAGSGIADGSRSDGGSGSGRTAGAEARASPGAGPVDSAGRGVAPGRQARRGCGRRRVRAGIGAPGRGRGEPARG